jgi:NAD(P)-dependent dehydrogenase (short-subunit alcohol dehydrogenase family)
VEAISASLAAEVAPGVCVLAVNPGVVATEMLATCFESDVSGYTPPAECAAAFVRMLKRADPGWNGRSLDVDSF